MITSVRERPLAAVEAFSALIRQEPGHWCRPVTPRLRCVEALDTDLFRADVEWHGAAPADEPERYVYLLRTVHGRPRIHVAMGPLPAASRAAAGGGTP